jgi:hypothetical protein
MIETLQSNLVKKWRLPRRPLNNTVTGVNSLLIVTLLRATDDDEQKRA